MLDRLFPPKNIHLADFFQQIEFFVQADHKSIDWLTIIILR